MSDEPVSRTPFYFLAKDDIYDMNTGKRLGETYHTPDVGVEAATENFLRALNGASYEAREKARTTLSDELCLSCFRPDPRCQCANDE